MEKIEQKFVKANHFNQNLGVSSLSGIADEIQTCQGL